MDISSEIFTIPAGGDVLRVPFVINFQRIKPEDLDVFLNLMEEKIGAKHFRTAELFKEVLADRVAKQMAPRNFLYGPFVGVVLTNKELRLTSVDAPQGGMTVYAPEQFLELANAISEPFSYVPTQPRRMGMR